MIGIIGAMNVEINGYLSLLEKHVEQSFGCFHFHTGLLCNKEVVIAKPVSARSAQPLAQPQ